MTKLSFDFVERTPVPGMEQILDAPSVGIAEFLKTSSDYAKKLYLTKTSPVR